MWDEFESDRITLPPARQEQVLVVIVPSQRDWDLVLNEHWYRIPVSRAPRRVAADYLAFY
ncbi:MAG: hypothetical protein ACYC6L_10830 [Anaerolineae bacterium]